jgi:chemotaxis protein CheC
MTILRTDEEKAAFQKIATDCSLKCAEALGMFSGNALTVKTVNLRPVGMDDLMTLIDDPEETVVGVSLGFEGGIEGTVLSYFPLDHAATLIESLMGERPNNVEDFDEMAFSALGEAGNILVSAFLNALSIHTDMEIMPTPPFVAIEMSYAVITGVALPLIADGGEILSLEADILPVDENQQNCISCRVFLIPTTESWEILRTKLVK